jgi:hypothetical protein
MKMADSLLVYFEREGPPFLRYQLYGSAPVWPEQSLRSNDRQKNYVNSIARHSNCSRLVMPAATPCAHIEREGHYGFIDRGATETARPFIARLRRQRQASVHACRISRREGALAAILATATTARRGGIISARLLLR